MQITRLMGDSTTSFFLILSASLVLAGLSSSNEFAFGEIDYDDYEYRTFDGTGNNLANPDWGSAGSELLRNSGYGYEPMSSISGSDRQSPRVISNIVADQSEPVYNQKGASDFIWQWGQFLDHDIDLTISATPTDEFNISVPLGDDPFDLGDTGNQVISFSRSKYVENIDGRDQINEITAFIDASNVYGSSAATAEMLRVPNSYLLKTSGDGKLLPKDNGGLFFMAGDVRANEQIGLTAMHTLFVLEHNRVAEEIKQENPDFSDDQIFQLARKIIGAKMQVITYNEFLPILLGQNAITQYQAYNSTENPGIANEFSTASYRYGHSQLSSSLLIIDENEKSYVPLRDAFFNPILFEQKGLEPILNGLAHQKAQEIDTLVVDDVRNFLFTNVPGNGAGFDLASLNIQRGRDHGLPDYNTVRLAYNLEAVNSFAQISSNSDVQAKLAAAYNPNGETSYNYDNIDLWVGGLAEDHLPGAMVGETIHAVLKDQFERLRDGDRFWYENDNFFDDNKGWKNKVHKTTLKKVIDDNTSLDNLYRNIFKFKDFD